MVTNNKVLTVSYGTFSCTLEGFEDSFETMKAIAEYFRDLAADDRYFGAEPPSPDAEMLARIAEREIDRRVQARTDQGTLVLTAGDALPKTDDIQEPDVAPAQADAPVLEDQIAEGEETVAIDEDQLAEEREAFFADVDSVAHNHAAEVAEDVAAHEAEAELEEDIVEEVALEDAPVEADVENAPVVEEAVEETPDEADAPVETEVATYDDDEIEKELQALKEASMVDAAPVEDIIEDADEEIEEVVAEAPAEEAPVQEAALAPLVLEEPVSAPVAADDYEDEAEDVDDADNFFAGTKAQKDKGGSSIAAKLSRIRAVVSKAEEEETPEPYTEDEHAENPAADFLRKSASDIEGSLEDEDEVAEAPAPAPAAAPARRSGRVIRMRRSEKRVQAEPAPVAEPEPAPAPVAEDPEIEETPIPVPETAEAPAPAVEEFEETVGEDTVAEFESGYATTELDEESYDEEIQEEAPRPARARRQRAALTEDTQADSMDRLLNEANDKLEDPATSRRRTTLAHLRAAVAATRAEKSAGTYEGDKDQSGAYREDLADVMRPRREAPVAAPEVEAEDDAAPLRLVASQRVDAAPAATEEAVRPRRVSPADISSFEPKEDSDFAEYAEEVGATELPDILEAAASYLTYVEGRRRFSRPMLMRLAYQVGPDRFQREAGLRSFGQLLRDKKIEKIAGGRFTVAETIGFKPESAAG